MRKLFTLLAIAVSSASIAQSTIPNQSFENWSDEVVFDSLEQWTTSNSQMYAAGQDPNCWQNDADPQEGMYSWVMETVFVYDESTMENDTIFGFSVKESANDAGFTGFPYADTVNQLNFWYKCGVETNDTAYAIVQLMKGGTMYAGATYQMFGDVSSWTEVNLNIPGGEAEEPDSVFIGFASSDVFTDANIAEGSWIEIDNVSFSHTVGSMTTPSEVPNYSFENLYEETLNTPDSWWSFDPLIYAATGSNYVNESTDASDGSSSIEINTTLENVFGGIPSVVSNGEFDFGSSTIVGGEPLGFTPDTFRVDVQYTPAGIDTAFVWLKMWNDASGVLIDTVEMVLSATTAWEERAIGLDLTEAPDSVQVTLYSGSEVGSMFLVDNIRFTGGDLGVNTVKLFDDRMVYPNPTNNNVNIAHDGAEWIRITNIAGQTIYQTNNINENKTILNTSEWTEGIYLIQLNKDDKIETKKLVVKH